MADFLDKLTSYNLFNYLLPGIVFAAIASHLTPLELIQDDMIVGVFFYYFLGTVISRFGSLFLEPLLKGIGFVKYEEYGLYLKASKSDEKIGILLEASNMYRTMLSVFVLLAVLKAYFEFGQLLLKVEVYGDWMATLFLLALFLYSYRKQTKFISKRIRSFYDE